MAILLGRANSTRRLALAVIVFLIIFLYLRSPSSSTTDYEPPQRDHETTTQEKADDGKVYEKPNDGASIQKEPDSENVRPVGTPRDRVSKELQKILKWDAPKEIKNHYPPYSDYDHRDYDPNRWEAFKQNQAYYYNGSIDQIPSKPSKPQPYNPYPSYSSSQYQRQWQGTYKSCDGPDGTTLQPGGKGTVSAYSGVPAGFPKPDAGSFEAVGLDGDVCFDRESRLGPYGLHEDIDFSGVDWLRLQNACVDRNQDRFRNPARPAIGPGSTSTSPPSAKEKRAPIRDDLPARNRTAILIRTWDNYDYKPNDLQALRSMITELSLLSGGEYSVFLFLNVKDTTLPVFTDPDVYANLLVEYVPAEFRSIAILWTEQICSEWYPNVGEYSVYFQQWMPIQWFSQTHPEFEYVWNWEMDARYIGNHYHFLDTVASFAKKQPRKHLWERNARYYFPAVHGSYEAFVKETNKIVAQSPYVIPVWGPQTWTSNQLPQGPLPPTTEAADDFKWGVDEEADFITLLPMWDPRETWWSYRDKLWGFPSGSEFGSTDERPYPHVTRRTFINTLARLSRTLLENMHRENLAGVGMASEMWPSSVALQHGFKAVYAPHPVWFSQIWPSEYLEGVFNPDGWGAGSKPGFGFIDDGRGAGFDPEREAKGLAQKGTGPNKEGLSGRWGQERDAPYNPDREHNFGGWSWYFWSDFPKVLYWRWLGWKAGFSIVTIEGSQSTDELQDVEWKDWEAKRGRLCYPAMLLHPVKNVKEKVEEAQEG